VTGRLAGGLRTDVRSRCALILASNWQRLTDQLAANEFVEVPATQHVCSLCEVGMSIIRCVTNLNENL